jgi:hypothetical protein
MRLTTTLAASAVIAVSAVAANAGSLAPTTMEAPVVVMEEPAPAGSSVNPAFVVVGVLAALLIAAAADYL